MSGSLGRAGNTGSRFDFLEYIYLEIPSLKNTPKSPESQKSNKNPQSMDDPHHIFITKFQEFLWNFHLLKHVGSFPGFSAVSPSSVRRESNCCATEISFYN
jgi:hypothetical protein